ncbi:MAG: hypothetical protein FI716_00015, partial [SAR202 cluster bacterium]|nr:hypothetical protein [SAR202 cluster bacterium]
MKPGGPLFEYSSVRYCCEITTKRCRTMTTYSEFKLAPVQEAPFYLDRDASTKKACQLIEDAAQKGAAIAAFGETWLAGHPYFHDTAGSPLQQKAALEYITNGAEIPSSTTDRLCAAVRQAGIDVVIGIV